MLTTREEACERTLVSDLKSIQEVHYHKLVHKDVIISDKFFLKKQIILELFVTGNVLHVLDTVVLQTNRDASPLSRKKWGKEMDLNVLML